jgi:hypothetical protein
MSDRRVVTLDEMLDWASDPEADPADIPAARLPLAIAVVEARLQAVKEEFVILDFLDRWRRRRNH